MISFSTFQYAAFFPRLAVFSIGKKLSLPRQLLWENRLILQRRTKSFQTTNRLPEPNGPGPRTLILGLKQNPAPGAERSRTVYKTTRSETKKPAPELS